MSSMKSPATIYRGFTFNFLLLLSRVLERNPSEFEASDIPLEVSDFRLEVSSGSSKFPAES